MKNLYPTAYMNYKVLLLGAFLIQAIEISAQIIPTKGKDFWIAFPYHPYQISGQSASKRCDVFITSDNNTSGIISFTGWSQAFTVTSGQTTTVTIPVNLVEHLGSEIIENKGIHVVTADTVSVFSISFQNVSSDGTVVYPKQSLGTEYRVASYPGLSYTLPLHSYILLVATSDDTQIEVIPTVPTLGGKPAGVPFIVNLNEGQSYQILSSSSSNDFTGTVIKGTDSSGTCRPFAVYSGTVCTRIPSGCQACDVLYEQALPVMSWGTTYYSVPFSFASNYTIRILADQNNTSYSINGGAPLNLNAGQFNEINNVTGTRCITANKPVSVIQYMQGVTCAGAGDPSMMYLNSHDQKIDEVTFSTVTSTVITQHNVNVIMNTAHITQLTHNGIQVPSSLFTPLPSCNNISYAQISLSQGSHTLKADSGFTAYVYGTGSAESYAYSVGSFSKLQPIFIDSILCSNDTINLGTTNIIFGPWWATNSAPNDTIAIGPVLTLLPPIIPEIYILTGNEYISGCEKKYYFSVEIPDPPQLQISSITTTVCQNQQVQLIATPTPASSNYSYSWTPVTGINNPNIANPVLTATTSMWYYVTVSSPNGCAPTVYDSIYINVQPLPLPNLYAGVDQTICKGDSVLLSVNGTGLFSWIPGGSTSASITVAPSVTTNFIVYVTDSNGCQNSNTVIVIVNSGPVINAGTDKNICPGASATITAIGGVTYTWSPGGSTSNSITVSPSATTTYIVQGTSLDGCINHDTVQVIVQPLPVANAGPDQAICSGMSATLTASGGVSYLWNPGGATTSSISVSPPVTTNYTVTVADSFGCSATDTVLVSLITAQPALVNAGPDQTICAGTSASLSVSGGFSYIWMPGGDTTSTIVVSPANTTNYIVTTTDSNGCMYIDTVFVTVNPLPNVNAGNDQSVCIGDSVILIATGGQNYVWTPSGLNASQITVSPLSSIVYSVLVTDSAGCGNSDSVLVTVNSLPIADAGPDTIICIGDNTLLSAAPTGSSYFWYPINSAGISVSVAPTLSSIYIVEVTDTNGCINTDTVNVNVNPLPNVSAGNDQSICSGALTTIIASGVGSFLWAPSNDTTSTITVTPNSSTIYIVTLTDGNGCINSDTVNINVLQLPPANAGPDQSICIGDSISITASGGINYLWSPVISNQNTIAVAPLITTSYIVLVTDSMGCQQNDTVTITVNNLPVANAGPDTIICFGQSFTLNASPTGISYLWNPGNLSGISTSVTPQFTTDYYLEITDANGCKNYDTIVINVNPLPIADAGPDQGICPGSSTTLIASGGLSYQWNNGGGNSNPIIVSPIANTNYIVTVTDMNGCTNIDSVFVYLHPLPIVNYYTSSPVCENVIINFYNTSNITSGSILNTYWMFGDGNTSFNFNTDHVYPSAGNYTVTLIAESNLGCIDSITVPLTINPNPFADFTTDKICAKQPLQLLDKSNVSPGTITSWIWMLGDGSNSNQQNPVHAYLNPGFYDVSLTVISDSGCISTKTIPQAVEVFPLPIANFYPDPQNVSILGPTVHFYDQSSGGTAWNWDFGDSFGFSGEQNPAYTYSDTGVFHVYLILTNSYGCKDTANGRVYVEPYFTIYFPNAFSPNGDGKNDLYFPSGIGIEDFELLIFDRWGNNIFESNYIHHTWNGKIQGTDENCGEGVYVYKAKISDYKNVTYTYSGYITLIR